MSNERFEAVLLRVPHGALTPKLGQSIAEVRAVGVHVAAIVGNPGEVGTARTEAPVGVLVLSDRAGSDVVMFDEWGRVEPAESGACATDAALLRRAGRRSWMPGPAHRALDEGHSRYRGVDDRLGRARRDDRSAARGPGQAPACGTPAAQHPRTRMGSDAGHLPGGARLLDGAAVRLE